VVRFDLRHTVEGPWVTSTDAAGPRSPDAALSTPQGPLPEGEDARYQRILLLVVMLAVMAFGSLMTIVTVALGTIAADLDSSRATLTWVITGLMLAMAVLTPIGGKLGDIYGHRRLLLVGLVGGALTTVLCGLAWDATSLIIFRVLFGACGALVNPNAMSLMMHAYGPERRATATGWFQFAMTGAPTVGLVLGGPLIDVVGWRAIFFGFAAITVVAFALGSVLLRDTPRGATTSLDYAGAFALAVGVATGLLAITRITTVLREHGGFDAVTDPLGLALVVASGLGVVAFVQVERTVAEPMLKLDYFRRRNFTLPMISGACIQFAYMGGFVVTPALLDDRYGWTVGAIALLMTPRPASFALASPVGGYLPRYIGERNPIVLGGVCMVISMIAFALGALTTALVGIIAIVAGLVLSGIASGISQPSIASLTVGAVDPQDMGIANGMGQQVMFIGIVGGIQTMNVLIGDDASAARFAGTYLFGMAVALAGIVCAAAIADTRRQ